MKRYEILGTIGEGAYGIVLKCQDKTSKEVFAVKKFKDKDSENLAIKKVLLRELRALRALKHPNIIKLLKSFKQNERLYMVFEYIPDSLLDLIEKSPDGIDMETIKKICYGIVKGLAFMHEQGLIHRDIKPENILITKDNKAKVIDFGFTRSLKENEELTSYVATRWYRSLELLFGSKYGPEVDIWALGCMMAELVNGDPLFPGDDYIDQLSQIYEAFGAFPSSFKQTIINNKELDNINFSQYFIGYDNTREFIEDNYSELADDDDFIDLLVATLNMDRSMRITAKEALNHPFFRSLREEEEALKNSFVCRNSKFVTPMSTINKASTSRVTLNNIKLQPIAPLRKTLFKANFNKRSTEVQKENRESLLPQIKTSGFKTSFKKTLQPYKMSIMNHRNKFSKNIFY